MVVPILLAILLGILQVGYDLFREHLVSQSVQTAARMIQLGKVPATATGLRDQICASLAGGLTCANLYIDVRPVVYYNYLPFLTQGGGPSRVVMPSFGTAQVLCAGGPGDVVVIRAGYLATVISPLWPSSGYIVVNGQRVRGLSATAVIRNEPAGTVGWGQAC